MAARSPLQLATISDLHLFCRRSCADRYTDAIQAAAADADVFVLNGDIFDFRWSTLGSPERTVAAAVEWLAELVDGAPDCRFFYVLGNHDHYGLLMDALEPFTEQRANFDWDPYYFRLGPALFLHGDVVVRKMTAKDLEEYRTGWLADPNRGPVLNAVYDAAFRMGLHKAIHHVAFPLETVLDRLSHYVADIGHGAESGVETVYFGHTHLAMPHHQHNGLVFRNGGAPMPGLQFEVLTAELEVAQS
jgi:UDP-2,3-diacylglucosamine hydrolase